MFSTSLSFSSTDMVCEMCHVRFTGSDTLGPLLEDLGRGAHIWRMDTRLRGMRAMSGKGECITVLIHFSVLAPLFLAGDFPDVQTFTHLGIGGMVTWLEGLMPVRELPLGGSLFGTVSLGHS